MKDLLPKNRAELREDIKWLIKFTKRKIKLNKDGTFSGYIKEFRM